MAAVTLTDGEAALREVVGTAALLEGRTLARQGSVESAHADPASGQVLGKVRDGHHFHSTRISMRYTSTDRLGALEGSCTCGHAVPCRHAVAVMLTSTASSGVPAPAGAPMPARLPAPSGVPAGATLARVEPITRRQPAAWEGTLAAALSDRHPARDGRRPDQAPARPADQPPIALQFELTAEARPGIAIRPVVPGRSGGWVRSGVSWSSLVYPDYYLRQVPSPAVRLLKELHALGSATDRYLYQDRVVRLDSIPSRRVWDLLLEANEIGVPLVMAGRRAEPVHVHSAPAVARFDVRRDGDELVVEPLLEVAGDRVDAATPVGDPAHGIAWAATGPAGGLQLARLAAPPDDLFTTLTSSGPLRIPSADEGHFLEDYYPRLVQRIEVLSRDGSVHLPAARPPVLELTVQGLGGHVVELGWCWVYRVGATARREPLPAPAGGSPCGRDPAAETRVLRTVAPLLTVPGLIDHSGGGSRPATGVRLEGVATARLMAETVPALEAHPDVEVRTVMDAAGVPDYRDVDAPPVIRFAAEAEATGVGGFGEQDWFDLAVTVTVDGHDVPFDRLFIALAQGQSHLVLDNGVYFSLDRAEFAELAQLLAESRDLLDAPPATVRLSRYHADLWDEVERLGMITGQVESWREAVRALAGAVDTPVPLPAGLKATLRPYQESGFGWLATLFAHGLGGVLADDMGLGKTLQALALVQHVREQGLTDRPFLVVAPTSVVANWASEAARFTPDLTVTTVTQTQARRGTDVATAVAGADLVITSYTLFRLEYEQYRERGWAALVLDEAQNVKNHHSAGYRCARELPAGFKLAITGTPMENNLMELWSLLSITAPGLFARAQRFTEYYRTPIERGQDRDRLTQLRRRIRPLLLRRTKDQVAADLPQRQEQVIELELNPRHRAVYQKYLQRERQKVLGLLGDLNRNRFEILRSLTVLRQASLDAGLVDPAHDAVPSTKLDAVVEQLLSIAAEGHRVLVFSQFTRFLGRLRDRLDHAGLEHCYLDGTTRDRSRVIDRFRTGTAPVFLISLKAGGVGLNLTEADYVVLLDPWWNPATEAQAVDRAHRIGQTRNVMVYRLVAKDTIEEKVMALKERKAALTASVLSGDEFTSAHLTAQDIQALLS